jgi:hypothetical protein
MTANERRLLRAFRALPEPRQNSVLDFIEFLHAREDSEKRQAPAGEPLPIPRPEAESVVKAIKRLMSTYPMLERNSLLHETSALMAQHVVHKRPAPEVIDELESLFQRHYQQSLPTRPA